jgi:serine/threonine-protein kinase RsbW
VEISIALALPSDGASVPVARRVTAQALRVLGVDGECVAELELALTEACANVLDHAGSGDDYEVQFAVVGDDCVITVTDRGQAFDGDDHGRDLVALSAERGRGIALMRALVDEVHFHASDAGGTTVSMTKALVFADGAPSR